MSKRDSLITRLSVNSVKKFRTTIIAFVLILAFGFVSYTELLPRKGFPALDFPTIFVQVPYPVESADIVNEGVTEPIESVISNLENVESVASQTSDNFAFVSISYKSKTDLDVANEKLNEAFESNLELPNGAIPQITVLKTNAIDGENVILYALTGDEDHNLPGAASQLAEEIQNLSEINNANLIELTDQIYNPVTDSFQLGAVSFNRYGIKNDSGEIVMQESILIGINPEEDVTATEASEAIKAKIADLKEVGELNGFDAVSIYDEAVDLNAEITSLESNAFTALIAVAIVLFLFVSWRASIVATVFIPLVMCATFLTMLIFGVSLNVISLFALILVLGLLVDDMIVIVESIDYHKRHGFKGVEAVRAALQKVGKADLLGTITTVLVFFPMLLIIGFLGEIIKDVPITVIITLIWSLTIAVTIMPLFSNLIMPDKTEDYSDGTLGKITSFFGNIVNRLADIIANFINAYLSRKLFIGIVVVLSFAIIMLGSVFSSQLKFVDFPPQRDSNGVNITIQYEPGTSVENQEEIGIRVEEIVKEHAIEQVEEIKYISVGRDITGNQIANIFLQLTPLQDRSITSPNLAEELQIEFDKIEEARVIAASNQLAGPPSVEYQSQIQLYSNDLTALNTTANEIKDYIVTLELPSDDYKLIDTKISYTDQVAKLDGRRYFLIESKLTEGADDGTIRYISDQVKNKFTPEELTSRGLQRDALDDSRGFQDEIFESVISAGLALFGSFGIIYIFLTVTFNSFGRALLIMMAIPFSFFGLFLGLLLTGNPISFFVIIGMIALVGIVVNNTIMLQDFAIQAREEGKSIRESIVEAARLRFRPLMSTSVTTVVGLVPLAINEPLWESLSVAIIFGLISSTTLVIFVFPAYYYIIENLRVWKSKQVLRFKSRRA